MGTWPHFQNSRDVVEVFGMYGSFTEANQEHTMISQDPTVLFLGDPLLGEMTIGETTRGGCGAVVFSTRVRWRDRRVYR